ncbi:hypothetical protein PHYBLDRAFT_60902 [Phycomyces blakesleeanus NRRL 1555(-)]|uniref:Uncharacterized protein n=1 Tax=Phycomyces blakesleeanus (strain ATCC 8743b / DSM 1359 / FGSC 10004 / NBRC 33097 / NRRL 1555) TaxID=763407 RepID=A0A163B1K2_PHYB8|nr:hypothetical protein PHYBLDRAFT_60902 [Phycomyces blakesleeanus NRRL 1555(-)]OAD77781.1 hypothetical protein PHYBLDRAFT_60902 [Phycomyces blakesleeanus NRRL 1555(-)]|eukprot:XP_018295821.1 hypothetical protein PHYBLDRAFT_60902 [Phycomyces blakesleeanus NRRL 1555(-)]
MKRQIQKSISTSDVKVNLLFLFCFVLYAKHTPIDLSNQPNRNYVASFFQVIYYLPYYRSSIVLWLSYDVSVRTVFTTLELKEKNPIMEMAAIVLGVNLVSIGEFVI